MGRIINPNSLSLAELCPNSFIGKVCKVQPILKESLLNGKARPCFDVYYIENDKAIGGFTISLANVLKLFPFMFDMPLPKFYDFLGKQEVKYLGKGQWEVVGGVHPPTNTESEYLRIFCL